MVSIQPNWAVLIQLMHFVNVCIIGKSPPQVLNASESLIATDGRLTDSLVFSQKKNHLCPRIWGLRIKRKKGHNSRTKSTEGDGRNEVFSSDGDFLLDLQGAQLQRSNMSTAQVSQCWPLNSSIFQAFSSNRAMTRRFMLMWKPLTSSPLDHLREL